MKPLSRGIAAFIVAIGYLVIVMMLVGLMVSFADNNLRKWHSTGAHATFGSDAAFFVEAIVATCCLIEGVRQIFSRKYKPRTIKNVGISAVLVAVSIALYVFMLGSFWPDLRWVF